MPPRLAICVALLWWTGLVSLCGQTVMPVPQCSGQWPMWIIDGSRVAMIQGIDAGLAERSFNNPCTFIFGSPSKSSVPQGWVAATTADFETYADFQTAVSKNSIDPATRAVMYDNEAWSSPANELADPGRYTALFQSLAHANGYLFIATPGAQLMSPQAYLADIYENQSQYQEDVTSNFVSLLSSATSSARQANPNVVVFGGISTAPGGKTVTPDQVYQSVMAAKGLVSGFWLNIPSPGPSCEKCVPADPQLTVDFLRRLEAGTSPGQRKRHERP
jgi:hypothetical protein